MVDVPTTADFNALAARVTALEGGTKPPDPKPTESPEGYAVPANGPQITDALGNVFTITADKKVGINGAADAATANVAQEVYHAHQMVHQNTAGAWYAATMSGGPPGSTAKYASAPSPIPTPPGAGFTVSATGFLGPDGNPWAARGVNAGVQDALDDRNCAQQFPHMTILRLNCNSGSDSAANIDAAVKKFNAWNVVVLIEDHGGNTRNIAWYQQMANVYKGNPLVMLGTANEPGGNVGQDQIDTVNAIRGAGFNNPIGLQCGGGYKFDHLQGVLNAVGNRQLFCTPHIYYSGADPAGSQNYINADITNCKNLGLWCMFTEYGDGMDGWHRDQWGVQLCRQVIASQQGGQCGAVFWAMDNNNHTDGCCSAYAVRDGSRLTSPLMGVDPVQPWLRG